jgi:ribosomal protein L11 methyltransferase
MIDTIRLTVTLFPYESWIADLLMGEMAGLGFDTFEETTEGFEAYIPENLYREEPLDALFSLWEADCRISRVAEIIEARNWNEVWEKNYFQPLVIQDKVVVRAPFHQSYPACPIEIIIEPKMAFGTGNHETTSLVMETMLEMDFTGKSVLDMGCGTGILAILASKLGAREVTAIDNDPWSFEATSENILLNKTLNVKPLTGDSASLKNTKFHTILANIQKNVILKDLEHYYSVLLPGGKLVVSGFFEGDLPEIRLKAGSYGLKSGAYKIKNNWIAAVLERP